MNFCKSSEIGGTHMNTQLLNGSWEFKSTDSNDWIPAKIPGTVYQNLLDAGLIEDPFYRDNEIDAMEISEKDYDYRRSFQLDPKLQGMERLILFCDGIDTLADIEINGTQVLHCDNMHRRWEADITELVTDGENEIIVHFTSPCTYAEMMKKRHPDMDLEGHLFQAHMQIRKAAYMFGWDWGPALPDMGIWKSIGIQGFQTGRIRNFKVDQKHGFERVTLTCTMENEFFEENRASIQRNGTDDEAAGLAAYAKKTAGKEIRCRISVEDPDGTILCTKENAEGKAEFIIENPKLWWCRGYGEQPLYQVTCEIYSDGQCIDRKVKRIGLRTLELCQDQDRWGTSFYFRINGVEVFAKGADYIPEDSLLGRYSAERSKKLLDSCLKANFNMIRIWGGGVYPADEFLDYCDEKGLMIWQDFMFANLVTIWHGEEKENMTAEIVEQTRRFREHPCIALLCGNNETELMIWDDMNPKYKEMYIQQYEKDMKELVHREAPDIFYWPSSPSSKGSMWDVENENYGDSHDWRVWHGELPFTHYRSTYPRFNSEFGLQSFPCMKTIETFTLPEDRNIFSYVMENHQKSKNGNRVINSYISQYFKFPKDFRALVYLSQMIQMEGIRYGVEHWRRNRNDRRCMGTLFWQVNDCWQVASWASIDCFGRWKGLQYGAKRFYEPVLVSAMEEGTTVELHISNEMLTSTEGILRYQLFHVEKGLVQEKEIPCKVRRLHSERIVRLEFEEILKTRQDMREYYLAYSYTTEGNIVGEGTVLFVPAKHFEFRKPAIRCEKVDDCIWKLTTDEFAKFVEVDFGEDILLSDNYFDLVPGQEKYLTTERAVDAAPQCYCLYDSILRA